MKLKFIILLLSITIFTSCNFINNTIEYNDSSKEFMNTILKQNVDKSLPYFALESEAAKNVDINQMKNGLEEFRTKILDNFGSELNYEFISANKHYSSVAENNTPKNTTVVNLQFENETNFGVVEMLYDDNSKKLLNINILDVKQPIPNTSLLYVIGLISLIIPIFNIYVINKIRKSNLSKKWLKYIAVVIFNFPTFIYNVVTGLGFKIFQFTFLGLGFQATGYLNSVVTIGIPIAGIYWFWKLKDLKKISTAANN